MATTNWGSASIPYVNPSKLSDSTYQTKMTDNGTWYQEHFHAYMMLYIYLRGQAPMIDYDDATRNTHLTNIISAIDGIESYLSTIHADLGTQSGIGYKLQEILGQLDTLNESITDAINDNTDTMVSQVLSSIDQQFEQIRNDVLTEGGKYKL